MKLMLVNCNSRSCHTCSPPGTQHPLPTLVGLDQGGKVRHAKRGVRHPTAQSAGAAWAGEVRQDGVGRRATSNKRMKNHLDKVLDLPYGVLRNVKVSSLESRRWPRDVGRQVLTFPTLRFALSRWEEKEFVVTTSVVVLRQGERLKSSLQAAEEVLTLTLRSTP
jgi:hypothetical protein